MPEPVRGKQESKERMEKIREIMKFDNRLMPKTKKVLSEARNEAEYFDHSVITPEHILLVLATSELFEEWKSHKVLVELEDIGRLVEKSYQRLRRLKRERGAESEPVLTTKARKVIERAVACKRVGDGNPRFVGPEHLVMALTYADICGSYFRKPREVRKQAKIRFGLTERQDAEIEWQEREWRRRMKWERKMLPGDRDFHRDEG